MGKNGFLVVKKSIDYYQKGLINLQEIKKKQDIFKRYKGFEGEPWPENEHFEGLAQITDIEEVKGYYKDIYSKNINDCFHLIYLSRDLTVPFNFSDFIFCGYDFGFFISRYNHYSVLLHEVIFGETSELKNFINNLNTNLLLPDIESGKELDELRKKLIADGNDLETAESFEEIPCLIAIYKYCGN